MSFGEIAKDRLTEARAQSAGFRRPAGPIGAGVSRARGRAYKHRTANRAEGRFRRVSSKTRNVRNALQYCLKNTVFRRNGVLLLPIMAWRHSQVSQRLTFGRVVHYRTRWKVQNYFGSCVMCPAGDTVELSRDACAFRTRID